MKNCRARRKVNEQHHLVKSSFSRGAFSETLASLAGLSIGSSRLEVATNKPRRAELFGSTQIFSLVEVSVAQSKLALALDRMSDTLHLIWVVLCCVANETKLKPANERNKPNPALARLFPASFAQTCYARQDCHCETWLFLFISQLVKPSNVSHLGAGLVGFVRFCLVLVPVLLKPIQQQLCFLSRCWTGTKHHINNSN